MDNNKMFTFMIVLAVTFIIMNLYFYYTKPAARQTQQQTANVDVSNDMFAQTAGRSSAKMMLTMLKTLSMITVRSISNGHLMAVRLSRP